ncbi:Uncharacterised protein [Klebsiella pneumoniae]|nr:Uncharacterised protein [Klebsiella pneumoniae]
MQIGRFKQQHLAALLHILRAEHHVPHPLMLPHLRVAHVAGVAFRQRQHRPQLPEGPVRLIHGQALPGGAATVIELDVAGVAQGQNALVIDGATGVAAVAVIRFVGHERQRLMLPVHQVRRTPVPPALKAMLAVQRVPLIEQVIAASKPDKPVRVVHQPRHRRGVPLRIVAVRQRPRLTCHNGLQDRRPAGR